jgi:hypothetical protein
MKLWWRDGWEAIGERWFGSNGGAMVIGGNGGQMI